MSRFKYKVHIDVIAMIVFSILIREALFEEMLDFTSLPVIIVTYTNKYVLDSTEVWLSSLHNSKKDDRYSTSAVSSIHSKGL